MNDVYCSIQLLDAEMILKDGDSKKLNCFFIYELQKLTHNVEQGFKLYYRS
jgi:hypothetical protein